MLSNKQVETRIHVGYTFIHNGVHHTIDKVYSTKLHCYTQEGGSYYMTYAYFQNTPHFKSRYLN
jgi:hypothetical protein